MADVATAELSIAEKEELLCSYAAMILVDAEQEITSEALGNLIKGSGNKVASYWCPLFAKMCTGKDMSSMLKLGGGGGGGGGGAAAGGDAGAAAGGAAEAKKEEVEEEEEEEMDFDLFG